MPIEKVPVVHKFGIISHSQRLELQERLLKQSYLTTVASHRPAKSTRNPFEVTEKFIQDYNNADSLDQREKLDDAAYKMLHRIKRRAGLKEGGTGDHVDLPVAWTELSQLAQCKGKIQEECLDVLITSLDQSPLIRQHIPALFFLAETTLYWLRTDAVHQPYLRTGEIKLLRMGQLVFTRLFYHHMAGHLQGHTQFKNRLFTYLDGFGESQEAYSPYPTALLGIRYMTEVGKIIVGDCNTESGEIKEGDNIERSSDGQLFGEGSSLQEETFSSHSAAISSSVHDLSPTLWHGLDVWRCVHKLAGGLPDAVHSLATCAQGLAAESWVDGICGLDVLCDAGKANLQVLRAIQNLARGVQPKPATTSSHQNDDKGTWSGSEPSGEDVKTSPSKTSLAHSHHTLSDILEKSEPFTSPTKSQFTKASPTKYTEISTEAELSDDSPAHQGSPRAGVCGTDSRYTHKPVSKEPYRPSRATTRATTQASGRSKTATDYTTMPNTACRAEVGSDLGPDGRASQASTVQTFSNQVSTELVGLHGWHWEVAITYADILADICLHGATSHIQKVAILGHNKDASSLHRTTPQCPMPSAGLLDLVYFYALEESYDGSGNDWSWRVRYAAIQGLVKICRCSSGDQTKEGIRTVAWNTLVRAHSLEKDRRVLEALKVGQVESNIENLVSEHMVSNPQTIGAKVAAGLSRLYLPPLPQPIEPPSPRRRHHKPIAVTVPPTMPHKPLRTSLREEILLANTLYEPAPSYNTRSNFDLKRVVEDQWRKELQKQIEEEEEERAKLLEDKQEQDEQEFLQQEEKRQAKLQEKKKKKGVQPGTISTGRVPTSGGRTKSGVSVASNNSLRILAET